MKIAINKCFGGFSLSKSVFDILGFKWNSHGFLNNNNFGINSNNYLEYCKHPDLIAAIKKVGEEKASGDLARIRVVDIPDDVDWEITQYDGIETIREAHRSW